MSQIAPASDPAERIKGIGGSDAAAALGLHPYKSAYELFLEKTGMLEPEDISGKENVHFGIVLEDTVAAEYSRRTGRKVRRRNAVLTHPGIPFMRANLDREVVGERRILECKTADLWTADQWGEEGTDQVPDHYLIQCLHYLAVTDSEVADLAVLIGGNRFRIYLIERNDELIAQIIEGENDFWQKVQSGTPPDPDGSSSTGNAIKRMWGKDDGNRVDLPPESGRWLDQLRTAKQEADWAESRVDEAKHYLQIQAGPASELYLNDAQVATWRTSKDGKTFNESEFKLAHPDLYKKFQVKTPGARPFKVKKG